MTFMTWLADQLDELGRVPRFSKVIFDDINNGCGNAKFGPIEWKEHFESEHKDQATQLVGLLTIAYANYVMDTNR